MAGILPTYILRGLTLDTVTEQLTSQLDDILGGVLTGPLKINLYLTIPSATLPLLEPLYLLSDLTSVLTLGMGSVNPFNMLANALAPALTSLVNLGYTDAVFNPETGGYERTLTDAGTPTGFFSFPDVDWGQAVGVILNQFVQGIQKEFFSGNPTAATPNVLSNLLGFLTGGLGPLGNLGALIQGILEGLNPLAATNPMALAEATDLPDPNARMVTMSTMEETDETATATEDSEVPAEEVPVEEAPVEEEPVEEVPVEEEPVVEEPTEEVPVDEEVAEEEPVDEEQPAEEQPAEEESDEEAPADQEEADEKDADESTEPKHAKPDTDVDKPAAQEAEKQTAPKHAKPDDDANAKAGADNSGSTEKAAA
jgi:hypothetical protein